MDQEARKLPEEAWNMPLLEAIFNPANADAAPYKSPGQIEQGVPRTNPAVIQCTKDILNAA